MSFFSKKRGGGGKPEGACGGGISGPNSGKYIVDVSFKIPGAGEDKGYDQNVVKRSGANKK